MSVTTVEWNILDHGEPYLQPWTESEDEARSYSNSATGPVVCRTRTRFADRVSKWHVPTTAGEGERGEG